MKEAYEQLVQNNKEIKELVEKIEKISKTILKELNKKD
jgi:hypothetical protein